jgi:hypothetical protein
VPSIEVDEATTALLEREAERRGITVARMTMAAVRFAVDEVEAKVAALSAVERPEPSPEFVVRAMEHGRKLIADLRDLERAGWPAR